MEFVFVWVLCAIIAAVVASARGVSGCLGLALGFLLGPIGIIIMCALPGNKPVPVLVTQAGDVESGPTRICPFCRSRIPNAANVCRFCQRESESEPAPLPESVAVEPGPDSPQCRYCKMYNKPDAQRCAYCAAGLPAKSPPRKRK